VIVGVVAAVAVIGVVAALLARGGGGGSDIADDGAHKLVAPATVIDGTYKKGGTSESDTLTEDDIEDAESWGVKNPKDVTASYSAGTGATQKQLMFAGVWGTIDDPEKAVDAMLGRMNEEAEKESGAKITGSPTEQKPAGFDNGVMKCQEVESTEGGVTVKMPFCVWGDHSTLVYVLSFDYGALMGGKAQTMEQAAELAAKLRKDVRVKA
jgi:hypothetical protein